MQVSSAIAAQIAQTQQNVALSVIKQSAAADAAIAEILQTTVDATKGQNVNISV